MCEQRWDERKEVREGPPEAGHGGPTKGNRLSGGQGERRAGKTDRDINQGGMRVTTYV